MQPNQEQLLSLLRTLLQVVGTFVISRSLLGDSSGQWWQLISGAILLAAPTIWSMYAHTDGAMIKNVTAMTDVKQVVVAAGAKDGAGAAAADPNQPKVVSQ